MCLRCCRMSTSLPPRVLSSYWHNHKHPSSFHNSLRTSDLEELRKKNNCGWKLPEARCIRAHFREQKGALPGKEPPSSDCIHWAEFANARGLSGHKWLMFYMAKKTGAARFPEIRHFQDAAWDIIIHLSRHKLVPVMFLWWPSNETRLQPCSCSSWRRARSRWDGPGSSCLPATSQLPLHQALLHLLVNLLAINFGDF